ncbi:hypothetical protein A3649_10335 [Mycobacterium ulcerans]|nr:hypothetical protein A3649_10335 [Mycobacterium ulcerans]
MDMSVLLRLQAAWRHGSDQRCVDTDALHCIRTARRAERCVAARQDLAEKSRIVGEVVSLLVRKVSSSQ